MDENIDVMSVTSEEVTILVTPRLKDGVTISLAIRHDKQVSVVVNKYKHEPIFSKVYCLELITNPMVTSDIIKAMLICVGDVDNITARHLEDAVRAKLTELLVTIETRTIAFYIR